MQTLENVQNENERHGKLIMLEERYDNDSGLLPQTFKCW